MPRTMLKEIYKFNELSDDAKEHARDWWRECETVDSYYHENVISDAEEIADIIGIRFRTHDVRLMNGRTRVEPNIYWSGFSSQGDGACFEGTYLYEKGAAKKIREYAPIDAELHRIADALQDAQRCYFYRLRADVNQRGPYQHSGCTWIEVSDPETYTNITEDAQVAVCDALRAFMDWIYAQLRSEYEYAMSDENVDENIVINEYEFDEDGRIV